jgi:opacity protein-like surface antigen
MNKFRKILCLFAVAFLLITVPVFSDTDIPGLDDLQKTVGSFTDSLASSLPFNSTIGLNWSEAHIGKFPHFGIGITTGFTTMNFDSLNGLLNMFKTPFPEIVNVGGFSLPAYTIDARLGGFFLPFDIGVKFGFLNFNPDLINGLLKTDIPGFNMDYLLIGGDIRYALVNGKTIPFKLSVGAGFNYLKGGMSMPVPGTSDISFNVPDGAGNLTLIVPKPELGLNWETKTLDFKAQTSFKLLVITPYIGIGASHAWSSAGYGITSKVKVTDENGDEVPLDSDTKKKIEAFGIDGVNERGFSQVNELTGWSFRTFGGFSINLPFVKFDITGMYDFLSECYGFTFGARLQF